MDKLTLIRNALETNPNIVIVNVEEYNYLPDYLPERDRKWSHVVNFIIAPQKGVYNADHLRELMMNLVPDIEFSIMRDFGAHVDVMNFGGLYFEEIIGEENITRKITLTDPKLFNTQGFQDGEQIIENRERLLRSIGILMYPDTEIASIAPSRGGGHRINRLWIFLDELKQFRDKKRGS